jgi:heme/copper-type cytochrome/quinol oxidase subunit 2
LDWFHNYNCSLLVLIIIFVSFSYFFILSSFYFFKLNLSYQELELFGTLVPVIVLVFQAIPSLSLLFIYSFDGRERDLTVKVVGHQWY